MCSLCLNAFCSTLALSQSFLLNAHCVSVLSAPCSLCLNASAQCSLCLNASAQCSLCLNAFCSRFALPQCFLLNAHCVSLKKAALFQQPEDQLSQPVRPKGGGKKKAAPGSTARSQPSRSGVAAATSHPSHTTGLPAHRLAEISRLLGQYSEDVEASSSAFQLSSLQSDPSSLAQILSFLASLPPPQQ